MDDFPRPPFPEQQQPIPGATDKMDPRPDHGEDSYKGSGRLEDKKVLITGGDSGIGRAVATLRKQTYWAGSASAPDSLRSVGRSARGHFPGHDACADGLDFRLG